MNQLIESRCEKLQPGPRFDLALALCGDVELMAEKSSEIATNRENSARWKFTLGAAPPKPATGAPNSTTTTSSVGIRPRY